MKRFELICLALVLGFSTSASAAESNEDETCDASDQGGIVVSIELIDRINVSPQQTLRPSIDRLNSDVDVEAAQGVALCRDDILNNPLGSNEIVRYRLYGFASKSMAPGNTLKILGPTVMASIKELLNDFYFYFSDTQGVKRSGVKGIELWPTVLPLPPQINVVAVWGPLTLAWPPGVSATVTIASPDKSKTQQVQGAIQIDIQEYCIPKCTLEITTNDGFKNITEVSVVPIAAAPMPQELQSVSTWEPIHFAVEGAWLASMGSEESWRIQGASLIWSTACDYPALDRVITQQYQLPIFPEFCEKPANF